MVCKALLMGGRAGLAKILNMQIQSMALLPLASVLLSVGTLALLTGCECPAPVRECRTVTIQSDCGPRLRTTATAANQEWPDGIHRLAGAPLYYAPDNLNWEQAPPFGRW